MTIWRCSKYELHKKAKKKTAQSLESSGRVFYGNMDHRWIFSLGMEID